MTHEVVFIGHRFGRQYGPDSSQQALERALSAPLGGIETDCCLTADGELVLLHDTRLENATTLAGWASDRSGREIRDSRLLDRSGAPTDQRPLELRELLQQIAGRDLLLQLEVKSFADADLALRTAGRICDLLAVERREGVEIISFWPEACALAASRGLPSRPIVACAYEPDLLASWASASGISGIHLEAPYFSSAVVSECSQRGLSVSSGVVNQVDQLERVLEFEPVAVSSDRPHELRAELMAGASR